MWYATRTVVDVVHVCGDASRFSLQGGGVELAIKDIEYKIKDGTKVDGSEAAMLWILPFTAPRCTNNSVLDLPRNLYIQYSASFRQEMFYNITGKYHLKSQSKARLATAPQQRY